MNHDKQIDYLRNTYGQIAITLDSLAGDFIDAPDQENIKPVLDKVVKLCGSEDVKQIIHKLANDKYAHSRAVAADIINLLWLRWKYISSVADEEYTATIKKYTKQLDWTLPLIEKLLCDPREWPAREIVYAVGEFEEDAVELDQHLHFSSLLSDVFYKTKSKNLRLIIVRQIVYLCSLNEDGDSILDEKALKMLIDASTDDSENVRDWACFVLHNNVDNVDTRIEEAMGAAIECESPDSDVYMEAVTCLATFGSADAEKIICENLARDDVGNGWFDAVQSSQSAACIEALLDCYKRLLTKDPDDFRLDFAERIIEDWNE